MPVAWFKSMQVVANGRDVADGRGDAVVGDGGSANPRPGVSCRRRAVCPDIVGKGHAALEGQARPIPLHGGYLIDAGVSQEDAVVDGYGIAGR